jgi:hypothetical protein
MSKIRINDLARELEVKSREILDVLTTVGVSRALRSGAEFRENFFAPRSRRRRDQDQDRPLPHLAPWRCPARHPTKSSRRTSRRASGCPTAGCAATRRNQSRSSPRSSSTSSAEGCSAEARRRAASAARAENRDSRFGCSDLPSTISRRNSAQGSRSPGCSNHSRSFRQRRHAWDRRSPARYSYASGRTCREPAARRSASVERYPDATSRARQADRSHCAAATHDHAPNRPPSGLQGPCASAGSNAIKYRFASRTRTPRTRSTDLSAHRKARRARTIAPTASSR